MKRSTSRILTTHTGSLPRSRELQELLRQRERRWCKARKGALEEGPDCTGQRSS